MLLRACCLVLLVLAPPSLKFVAAIDPAYARNITVYHVNPVSFGPYPINMNTADAVGDLFFDMNQVGCRCRCRSSAWWLCWAACGDSQGTVAVAVRGRRWTGVWSFRRVGLTLGLCWVDTSVVFRDVIR